MINYIDYIFYGSYVELFVLKAQGLGGREKRVYDRVTTPLQESHNWLKLYTPNLISYTIKLRKGVIYES